MNARITRATTLTEEDRMHRNAFGAMALAALLLTGCARDVATQMNRSQVVRGQVMTAVAGNALFAEEMTQRLMESDSLRVRVIETMLLDPRAAQYVLGRVGRNPDAMDYVLQAALADSIGRAHLVARMETIRKGLAAGR